MRIEKQGNRALVQVGDVVEELTYEDCIEAAKTLIDIAFNIYTE